MFPLIAISAFFILGIAFFAIGKDDFGIKRIKEDSNDTSSKEKEAMNQEMTSNNESAEGVNELRKQPLQEKDFTANITD